MILTCPSCQTRYTVDAAKFPPQGRDVRCARCGNVWHAEPQAEVSPEPEIVAAPVVAPVPEVAPEPPREAFLRSEERDPEPQPSVVAPAEAVTAPSWHRAWLLRAGWIGLAAVVILVGVVATVYRHQVVAHWPQSASLYAKLGMKVPSSALKIENTKNSTEMRNGRLVLTVTGTVTNVAERELPVPQIRIGLVDGDKRELYHWNVAPFVMTLKPGQSTRFVTQLSDPPEGAANYQVRFAKAGE